MNQREVRRMSGFVAKHVREKHWSGVSDPRAPRGRRWKLPQILKTVVVGMMAGARGLGDLERLTQMMGPAIRGLLGITRRLPDTTVRDVVCRLSNIDELRAVLHHVVVRSRRSKALLPAELPISVVSMDGKSTALTCWDTPRIQRVQHEGKVPFGLMRTVTSTLVTARGRPCIDVNPIHRATNEMGWFQKAFGDLVRAHGRLFELVTYDAGADSEANAAAVVRAGKHYMFHIAQENWHMTQLIRELLMTRPAIQIDTQKKGKYREVERSIRVSRVRDLSGAAHKTELWAHTRTIVQVDSKTWEILPNGERELRASESRVFCSSLPTDRLTTHQWAKLVRLHWGVETTHQILDTAFAEDDHPWVINDGHAALAIAILRRVAYTLLTLFRSVTQRSDDRRCESWRTLMERLRYALIAANDDTTRTLRTRKMTVCR